MAFGRRSAATSFHLSRNPTSVRKAVPATPGAARLPGGSACTAFLGANRVAKSKLSETIRFLGLGER